MKTYRYEIYAHEEVDIQAKSQEEAKTKVEAEWNKRFTGMFGDIFFLKTIDEHSK